MSRNSLALDPFNSSANSGLEPVSSRWNRFKNSFKPAQEDDPEFGSNVFVSKLQIKVDDEELTDLQRAAIKSSKTQLSSQLSLRHLLMIAIGATIGTGLFVNSGAALNTGGPASLIIGWCIVATMIYPTLMALAELCVAFPVTGGFITHATRFVDPSFGFAMGWCYAVQWIVALPLTLVAAAITIRYWRQDINSDVWVAVFYVFIFLLNMLHVRHFGETEVFFGVVKLLAIAGFFILGIVMICGGGPQGGYIGGEYWHDPGAFANGFKGVCSVFVTAAFSFAGSEVIGMTAAETEDPRQTIPAATKRTFWVITLSYTIILILIGCLVPWNEPRLTTGDSYAAVSPFVISIKNAGIKGLPSLMNVIILFAILSVANSSVYATSRVLSSLADIGFAPSFLGYIDRTGRPLYANLVTFFFGLIAFVAASDKQSEVFVWLLAMTALSTIFAWVGICGAHIRFRLALKQQGRTVNELTYVAPYGIYGSTYGIIMNFVVVMGQFWVALFPGSKADAKAFFEIFLSLVLFIVLYFGHKIYKRNWKIWIRLSEVDIDTGRKHFDIELLKQEIIYENERVAASPWWYRLYKVLC